MNEDHRDQTQLSPEKNILEKGKWIWYYLYIRYLLYHRQTNKQAIYSFNDIQAPGLHIVQYHSISNTVITTMIII